MVCFLLEDMDVVEVYDVIVIGELMYVENLMLVLIGEVGLVVECGDFMIGGLILINLFGGLEFKGYFIGVIGLG